MSPPAPDAPERFSAAVQVLDVRNPPEWQAGHLPTATCILLHELRKRVGELDKDKPVMTVCRGGQRAYYAARILRQHGFKEVSNLSGGMFMQQFAGRR